MQRKSQVSMFMLFGVVLVLIIGTIGFLFLKAKSAGVEEGAFDRFLQAVPLKSYVTSCLDQSFSDALYRVGRQGSIIYSTEAEGGKPFFGPPTYKYGLDVLYYKDDTNKEFDVSFGIVGPLAFHSGSATPYPGQLQPTFNENVPYFGKNNLPKLCDASSANAYDYEHLRISCGSSYSTQNNSIQYYLEAYALKKTDECLKNSDIAQDPTFKRYNVGFGVPFMNITVGETDMSAALSYPITIRPPDGVPVTKEVVFTSKQNIRLKKLYMWAQSIIEHETKDIMFHLPSAADKGDALTLSDCKDVQQNPAPCWHPGFDIIKKMMSVNTQSAMGMLMMYLSFQMTKACSLENRTFFSLPLKTGSPRLTFCEISQ